MKQAFDSRLTPRSICDTGVVSEDYSACMLFRSRVVQNKIVAREMRRFFRSLDYRSRSDGEMAAKKYAEVMWAQRYTRTDGPLEELSNPRAALIADKTRRSDHRSRFYVGLSAGAGRQGFEQLTKRCALVSDTLLLSHHGAGGAFYPVGLQSWVRGPGRSTSRGMSEGPRIPREAYGISCPDLPALGKWILDAEFLLKAGLCWYLPNYSTMRVEGNPGSPRGEFHPWDDVSSYELSTPSRYEAIDYLIEDGRAVDASGAEPIKSQLVRPALRMDLPFLDDVGLRDFSKITIEEFAAYSAFRDFLRQKYLDLDESLNNVQSERELVKLGLEIKDQVRSAHAEMTATHRKRAVSVTGAAIGSVGAILVAVYGPALAAAVATIGAGSGLWGIINAAAENSTRALREDKWHYVWALEKKADRS